MEVMMRTPGSQFPMWGGAGPRFSEAGPRSVEFIQQGQYKVRSLFSRDSPRSVVYSAGTVRGP